MNDTPGANANQPRGLTTDQLRLVHAIFEQAMDLDGPARETCIVRLAAGDQAVCVAASELLQLASAPQTLFTPHHDGLMPQFLGPDGGGLAEGPLPEAIGPYRIERLIGRGGMGVVYLATQSNPNRQVALKLLANVAASAASRRRFALEIEVLGRLDDPGIAHIYQAGSQATERGPVGYFAMEYIAGPRLTDFAKAESLTVAQRLRLIAKIADALHHAHTKGVLHRDLKPANILVAAPSGNATRSAEPQPKILDFGVARLVDDQTHQTALTEAGLLVGTVAYMSPEQLAGVSDDIDTRTDIYALGVVMYELLCGHLPHDVVHKPVAEAARMIRDDAAIPLTRAANGERLDQDLITIVQKAMAKDRQRRYSSAAALAEDVRRYLANEPIAARPPTAVYQLSKFASRNRALVAALAVSSVVVVAALVTSVVLLTREQAARERSDRTAALNEAIRDYMINGLLLNAAPSRMGYDVKMRDILEKTAAGLGERFAKHPELEVEVRWDLANVFQQLAQNKAAIEQCKAGLELAERLSGPQSTRAIGFLTVMARAHRSDNKPELALEAASLGVERITRRLPENAPEGFFAFAEKGAALVATGRYAEAIAPLNEALRRGKLASNRDEASLLAILDWLRAADQGMGNTAGALGRTREIASATERLLGPDSENTLGAKSNLLNELMKAGLFDEAAKLAEGLPETAERICPPGHPVRAYTALSAATAMARAGRFAEAKALGHKAHQNLAALNDDLHWTTERAASLLRSIAALAKDADELQRWSMETARIRLMVANADEETSTLALAAAIRKDFGVGGLGGKAASFTDRLWAERNQLAPAGHPRRAAFLANLAVLLASEDKASQVATLITESRQALPEAKDPAIVQAILDRVAKAGVEPRPASPAGSAPTPPSPTP
jgi:serine/threonine protein kinase